MLLIKKIFTKNPESELNSESKETLMMAYKMIFFSLKFNRQQLLKQLKQIILKSKLKSKKFIKFFF